VAVPKRKTSRSNTRSRRSAWKARPSTYAECPQCHQPKLPHRVCSNCGYYAGRQAVEIEVE
jgi:large subunit ribosomal protein L32